VTSWLCAGVVLLSFEYSHMRKPNTQCSICSNEIYRRPFQIKAQIKFYCSSCNPSKKTNKLAEKKCPVCQNFFKPDSSKSTFCSRSCSNKSRCGIHYRKDGNVWNNKSKLRLSILLTEFAITSCMVEGCNYNITYDIHRHIPGKEGGEYKIGNMFAICPNHHAEVSRGIIILEKVSDSKLKIKEVLS